MTTPYDAFLAQVIDDGIAAAREDYGWREKRGHKNAAAMLRGAVAGFEACRGKRPDELVGLLEEARKRAVDALPMQDNRRRDSDYWEARCFEGEVEWTCNVISAALVNQGQEPIVPPTVRGMMKAAEVLGVAGAQA